MHSESNKKRTEKNFFRVSSSLKYERRKLLEVSNYQSFAYKYPNTSLIVLVLKFTTMSYSGYGPPCPAPTRVKCIWCHMVAQGRCSHCRQRFNPGCFQQHAQTCPGARDYTRATLRLVPECSFCNNDASGACSWCNEMVCGGCFEVSHKVKTKRVVQYN